MPQESMQNQKSPAPMQSAGKQQINAGSGVQVGNSAQAATAKPESVTYLPRDGDPAKIKWGGRMFHANAPVMIDNPILLAKARLSKWFHVGEGAPHVEVEDTPDPKNPDQYRAHVASWLKTVETLSQLDKRYADEEELRISCGVGGEDFDVLKSLIGPKRAELKRAATMA